MQKHAYVLCSFIHSLWKKGKDAPPDISFPNSSVSAILSSTMPGPRLVSDSTRWWELGNLLSTGDRTGQVYDGKVLTLLPMQGLIELPLPCGPQRAAEGLVVALGSRSTSPLHPFSLASYPNTGPGVGNPSSQDCLGQNLGSSTY